MKKVAMLFALVAMVATLASAQTATPRVTKRQMKQQARIEQGVKSGELTKGEARRLERQQGKIAAEKRMAKADGVVTPAERAKLTHDQNRASKRIYRLKHNAKTSK